MHPLGKGGRSILQWSMASGWNRDGIRDGIGIDSDGVGMGSILIVYDSLVIVFVHFWPIFIDCSLQYNMTEVAKSGGNKTLFVLSAILDFVMLG